MSPHLARLHALAETFNITIGFAVIPGKLRPSLSDYLNSEAENFRPMCHGWMHINHGPRNRPAEFGRDRPLARLVQDAQAASQVFCQAARPIFVPPFNRISHSLTKVLPKIGFVAVSAVLGTLDRTLLRFKSRFPWSPVVSLRHPSAIPQMNVHIDPIDWSSQTALESRSVACFDHLSRRAFRAVINHQHLNLYSTLSQNDGNCRKKFLGSTICWNNNREIDRHGGS
jgi:hypothetical protein